MYDKGLILIKCTKGSYKLDNHKNPFTNGHNRQFAERVQRSLNIW